MIKNSQKNKMNYEFNFNKMSEFSTSLGLVAINATIYWENSEHAQKPQSILMQIILRGIPPVFDLRFLTNGENM